MPNPKLSTLVDPITAPTLNTALWSNVTGGAVTVDTVNDVVTLAQPTTSGATNTLGSGLYDATSSKISAQIGAVPNGLGNTKTIFKLTVDANNSVALRLEAGAFKFTLQTAGTTVTTTLATYSPDTHRWWRLREDAGTWYAEASTDGLTWATLTSSAYSWAASAVAMTFALQTSAGATEFAGLVAWMAHVNTQGGGRAEYNPNWPRLQHAWGPQWNCNGGNSPNSSFVDVTRRTRGTFSTGRGRQYELDQVRAGETSLTLANPDGAFDPTNPAGPWSGHIQPYQPYQVGAEWPATINLLRQAQATAGDLGGQPLGGIDSSNTGPAIYSSTDNTGGSFVTSTKAWQGSTVMQFAVPTSAIAATSLVFTRQPPVEPGRAYTHTVRVRNITASSSVQVYPYVEWTDAAGVTIAAVPGSTVTLTGSATANWSTLTVTGTAPMNPAALLIGVRIVAAPGVTCSAQVDGWQLEEGTQSSAWVCPGVWYPQYTGFVERWPSSWEGGGSYGLQQPTTVDALSLLSQVQLSDPLTQEISSHAPRFLYKLDDPQGSTSASDATGNYPGAQLGVSKYGPGSLVWGTAVTSASPGGTYTGSAGTVVTVNNPNPGTTLTSPATFLSLGLAGIKGPATAAWTRMLAFRYTGPTPVYAAVMWSAMDRQRAAGNPSGSRVFLQVDDSGHLAMILAGPSTGFIGMAAGSTNVIDGNWHLAMFGHDPVSSVAFVALDGVSASYSVGPAFQPTDIIGDNLGNFVDATVGNGTTYSFKGDLSFAAEFPSKLDGPSVTAIYDAWKNSCAGESTDTRYKRILRYAGYTSTAVTEAGLTTSMGAAATDGQDAVSALQGVVDTEGGQHYVSRGGALTFRSRATRYNSLVPAYVFGEDTANGEWPYEDAQLDFDATHISNKISVTQESTGQKFAAQDAASITAYFERTLERTINSSSADECQDAAGYFLSRYRQAVSRLSSIVLHPSALPAMWPVCLGLELGMRVQVVRRPNGAPSITLDCFVENIATSWDDAGEATWTLQLSPVDLTPYAAFAAWHTTLRTTVAPGVTSISVNASADTANPLATQLGPGQQIVLGQTTTNQETVTILSVGATSPGWTSATLTLTAATTKAHTAGDLINEPLPAGVTDPTAFDGSSRFDSAAFAY
ncbi:hypothetical protein [Streptomyces sp. NPDC050738]|uniref:hypothetical protein n=1 Tax=Streptomyces sp. NPDC050738 TaxID=3154744 RepID=UPI00343FA7BE